MHDGNDYKIYLKFDKVKKIDKFFDGFLPFNFHVVLYLYFAREWNNESMNRVHDLFFLFDCKNRCARVRVSIMKLWLQRLHSLSK